MHRQVPGGFRDVPGEKRSSASTMMGNVKSRTESGCAQDSSRTPENPINVVSDSDSDCLVIDVPGSPEKADATAATPVRIPDSPEKSPTK